MAGFRNVFIKSIYKVGNLIPSNFLLNITKQDLIFPFYHIISDENPAHIRNLYPIKNIKNFEKDLEFLLKHYSPIDFTEFQNLQTNKDKLKKPSFLLSFDDGLKEFHDVISPILLRKGIPAICFLNSDFIDNKELFYRYKASLLIDYLKINPSLIFEKEVQNFAKNNSIQLNNFSKSLLSISYQNQNYLDDLSKIIKYDFDEYLLTEKPYLTTTQIHSLKNKGFHFGAHSIDHPEYRFLSFDEQIMQTKESIEKICTQFSLNYKLFSFPFTDFGVSNKFFETIFENNIADFTFGCAGQKKEVFQNHIQRISFEMNNLTAKEIYNSELLYFIIKSFLGKNTIKR